MRDEQDLRRQMRAQQNTAPSRSVPRQRSPSIGAGGGGGGGGGGTGKAKAKARARGESRDLEDLSTLIDRRTHSTQRRTRSSGSPGC